MSNKRIYIQILFLLLFLFSGCYKNHLYVQIENIKEDFLASTHVKTPDYRQKRPPLGQRVVICWDFPSELYNKELTINLTVRLWNNTEEKRYYKIHRRWGIKTFFFSNPCKDKKKSILTYKIEITDKEGKCIETWQHQFWTELINVDKE